MTCRTCKQELGTNPLTKDCGGDCAHCMLRHEFDIGAYGTVMKLLLEMALGIMAIGEEQ